MRGGGESCSHPHSKLPGPQSPEGQMAVKWGGAQRGKPGAFVPAAAGLAAPVVGRGGWSPPGSGVCLTSAHLHQPVALQQPQLGAQALPAAACSVKLWSKRREGFWWKWALSQVTLAGVTEEVDSKFKMGYSCLPTNAVLYITKFKITFTSSPKWAFSYFCILVKNSMKITVVSVRFLHTNTRTHKPCRSVCITSHKAVTDEKEEKRISWDDSIVSVVIISKIGHFTHTSLFSYFLWQQTFHFFLLNFFKCLQKTFLWISFSIFYMESWLSSGPVFTVTSSNGRLCFKVKFISKTFSACISQVRFPFMKFPSWKKCELL